MLPPPSWGHWLTILQGVLQKGQKMIIPDSATAPTFIKPQEVWDKASHEQGKTRTTHYSFGDFM